MPTIEQHSVRVPSPSAEESQIALLRRLSDVRSLARQHGQTMVEYGVVLGVITVFVVAVFGALSIAIGGKLSSVVDLISP